MRGQKRHGVPLSLSWLHSGALASIYSNRILKNICFIMWNRKQLCLCLCYSTKTTIMYGWEVDTIHALQWYYWWIKDKQKPDSCWMLHFSHRCVSASTPVQCWLVSSGWGCHATAFLGTMSRWPTSLNPAVNQEKSTSARQPTGEVNTASEGYFFYWKTRKQVNVNHMKSQLLSFNEPLLYTALFPAVIIAEKKMCSRQETWLSDERCVSSRVK